MKKKYLFGPDSTALDELLRPIADVLAVQTSGETAFDSEKGRDLPRKWEVKRLIERLAYHATGGQERLYSLDLIELFVRAASELYAEEARREPALNETAIQDFLFDAVLVR
jgi:hypothetical protein